MKKLILMTSFLLALGLIELQAQAFFVKKISGTQTEYLLSNIKMMSFSSGSIEINKSGGTFNVYDLSGLRYLNFTDLSTGIISMTSKTKVMEVQVYPNPVESVLNINIQFPEIEGQTGIIEILSIEGKVFYTQMINSQSNIYQINASSLPQGLYFCRINNGITIETIKFFKK